MEKTITEKTITEDAFFETYKPVANPFDDNAPWGGSMLETYGPEYERVQEVFARAPETVWTVLDCDGRLLVSNGLHYVNRMGYIITEVPADADFITVDDGDGDDLADDEEDEA